MSDATTEPITWEAYNPGYLLMDANARTNGGVVYGRRILKRRPRADPHLDSQHAPAHRAGSDLGERPAALRGWLDLLRVISQLAVADTPAGGRQAGGFGGD